jgi:hypothetical protein
LGETEISIVHSPHAQNKNGDFYIEDDPSPIIRQFETLIFSGFGREALGPISRIGGKKGAAKS